jgi:hypothetical protein
MRTKKILSAFASLLTFLLLIAGTTQAEATSQKLSGYPNVWEWRPPAGIEVTWLDVRSLDNGDVLLSYYGRKQEKRKSRGANGHSVGNKEILFQETFFSREKVTRSVSIVSLARGEITAITLSNGAEAKIIGGVESSVRLRDGSTIRPDGGATQSCHYEPWNRYWVRDSATVQWTRWIYFVLDTPNVFSTGDPEACPEEYHPKIYQRLDALDGMLMPLSDGTFLAVLKNDLVVRFNAELQTNSPLLNQKLFVIDIDPHEIMRRMSGRQYEHDGKYGNYDYRGALDDIHQYLMTIKRGKK